jgi:1-acyl-sn-glycerol-3-phosphate acyltransferase
MRTLMAAPGWPDWLSHLWYRAHYAAIFAGTTAALSFRFAGGRHMPSHGPALLVANHQSFFDPPLVGLAVGRTIHYLARKTLYASPPFAWFLNSVNAHPVDQEGVATEGLRAIMELLKEGDAVLVFPEGERTWTGKMSPLKAGVHFLIKRVPVPIVPIGIAGAFEAYPRTSKLPKLSPLFLPATNHAIAAVVGEPLDPKRLLKLPREEFMQTVFNAIQAVQIKAERLRRKP